MLEAKFPDGKVVPFSVDTGTILGRGATAEVHSIVLGDRRYAAKVYKTEHAFDEDKILSMCGIIDPFKQSNFSVAWPLAAIRSSDQLCGYLMSSFEQTDHYPLNYYFDPTFFNKLRSNDLLSLSNRVEIARSLCRAFAAIHSIESYFIDLKPQNILVNWSSNSSVLLDCDGFSFKSPSGQRFTGGHISTDYVAPEATKEKLIPSELGLDQDKYALGVILFQLLNYAQHPFQGTAVEIGLQSATNDEHAAAGLYPYGLTANNLITPRKGSTHVCMPADLRSLFDRTFAGKAADRVGASEWADFFDFVIEHKRLKRCDRNPDNPTHLYFVGGTCPECLREQAISNFEAQALSRSRAAATKSVKPSPVPPLPSSLATPKTKGNTGQILIMGAVFAVLLLLYINAESSSPSVPEATIIPTYNTQITAVPIDPVDLSQVPASDIVTVVSESFRKNADGIKGTLSVKLPPTVPASSITKPGLFIAYFSCMPSAAEIQKAQEALGSLGFNVGIADGILGPRTSSAIQEFQRRNSIPITGKLDWQTAGLLKIDVAAYDSKRFKFYHRGTVRSSSSGPVIDFDGVLSSAEYCFYVSRH